MNCPRCGGTEKEKDPHGTSTYCSKCNYVFETDSFKSSLSFCNNKLMGGFAAKGVITSSMQLSGSTENKQRRIMKTERLLESVGSVLRLEVYQIEQAKGIYNDLNKRELLGRRTVRVVVGALLYIICRRDKTQHLLIDIADVVQKSIHKLANCYIYISTSLRLKISHIDPSLFIPRFCSKLDLCGKSAEIKNTALRLIQCMNRDWMSYGRRPTGLCGAAILISSKMYNLDISIDMVANTVHVCEETIRKRLEEFKSTAAAKLTNEEFGKVDISTLPTKEFPPCFKALAIENNSEMKAITDYSTVKEDKNEGRKRIHSISAPTDIPLIDQTPTKYETNDTNNYDESLSDLDKEGMKEYLLDEEESKLKATLWEVLNADWLKKQKEKKEKGPGTTTERRKPINRKRDKPELSDAYEVMKAATKLKGTVQVVEKLKLLNGKISLA